MRIGITGQAGFIGTHLYNMLGLENDIIVSPTVIPYDEFVKYKQSLPYYRNIAEEGKKIG